MPNINNIELRSEEIQELMDSAPGWMTRWGLSIIIGLIALIITLAWAIKYPDVIKGEIILTTKNPPIKIVSQASGKLIALSKSDGDYLVAGETFAEIENPVTDQGVRYLIEIINQIKPFIKNPLAQVSFNDSNYVFGHIHPLYNDLKKLCTNYKDWRLNNHRIEEIIKLKEKITQYRKLNATTNNLILIAEKELRNAEEKYKSDKHLYNEGVLARMEFFKEESNFHQKEQSYENLKLSAIQNQITYIDLSKQLLDIQNQQREKEHEFQNNISLKLHELENQIRDWRRTYQLTSPITGKLSLPNSISLNQFIKSGEIYFAIIPENEIFIGIMKISSHGLGKVKFGQAVRIKINDYPFHEYGQINGVVENISLLADEKSYNIQIKLTDGLKTSYGKSLSFKPEMPGTAEIITEDLKLIERIFYKFRKIFE